MSETKIEWADEVWNPTRGCSRVSLGCGGPAGVGGCYAERQAYRFSGKGMPYEGLVRMTKAGPRWTGRVALIPEKLEEPLHWKKPRRVFVNSMSDLFHEALPDEAIDRVFAVMALAPQHQFLVLTKRAARMRTWFSLRSNAYKHGEILAVAQGIRSGALVEDWPLQNVWLGVSVEDQATADERIPLLLKTPAAVRFVSYEPALGPLIFRGRHWFDCNADTTRGGIGWLICGGESGPGARPFDLAWARSVIAQGKAAGVPCFVKQLGSCAVDEVNGIAGAGLKVPNEAAPLIYKRLKNIKGGDMSEWPEDLRVREFPEIGERDA